MRIPEFLLSFSGPTGNIHLTAAERNCQSGLRCKVVPRATEGAIDACRENSKDGNCPLFRPVPPTLFPPLPLLSL
jgi:hypothetical protein